MRRAVSARLDRVLNLNTLLIARLIRLVVAVGISSFALLGLLPFFTLGVRQVHASPPAKPLAALCTTPAITLTAVQDTWIDENDPNQNQGDSLRLHTKPNAGDFSHSLVQFDLSTVPTKSIITCATLRVYENVRQDDQTIHVHQITNSWVESETTWINRTAGTPWTTSGGDYNSTEVTSFAANASGVYRDIDVTSLVQFWVDNPGSNFGTLLRSTTTGSTVVVYFDSREAANKPQLLVDYVEKPILSINKTGSSNFVAPGDPITYTIVISNDGNVNAVGAVLSDSLPANTNFVANSITLDPPSAGITVTPPILAANLTIATGQQVTVTFAVTVNTLVSPGLVITNTAEIISSEILGPSTASFTTTITGLFDPMLYVDKDGPLTATAGDIVTYTFTILNFNSGDGSPITNLKVIDSIAGAATYIKGDFNGNNILQVGEPWSYIATYTIKSTDPNPLVNVVTVQGQDQETEVISATDTHQTTIIIQPPLLFIPIIFKDH